MMDDFVHGVESEPRAFWKHYRFRYD